MSLEWMQRVWLHAPVTGNELLILLALADFAGEDGESWPSMATLAKRARVTERGARGIVSRLEAAGLLEITAGGGRHNTNLYHLKAEAFANAETRNDLPGGSNFRVSETRKHGATKPGSTAPETRKHGATKPGSPLPPNLKEEPSRNHQDEPSTRATRDAPLLNDDAAWSEFWTIYPRRVGKQAARSAWRRAVRSAPPDAIVAAARRYAEERRGAETRFIAHPATWLNQGRWDDDPGANRDARTYADQFREQMGGREEAPMLRLDASDFGRPGLPPPDTET